MTIRSAVAFAVLLPLAGAAPAAAQEVEPLAGAVLRGQIQFPRAQGMIIETDRADSSKLTVRMGFDGRCTGVLAEAWVSDVLARPTVRVRGGRFAADLRATVRDIGDVRGRKGSFKWRLTGRFVAAGVVRAAVTGTAVIRGREGRVLARCKIAKPTAVRLTTSGH
jgi:hypothetical protein